MLVQLDMDGTTRHAIQQLTQVDLDDVTIRDLKQLWQNDLSGVPRLIWSAMTVTIAPSPNFASSYSPGTATPTTSFSTATPVGGTAPYTYAWTVDNGWSLTSPTAQSVAFGSVGIGPGDGSDATGTVVVTDANGSTATATISLTSYNSHP